MLLVSVVLNIKERCVCMCESQENELKENNINCLIQLFVVYISKNVIQAANPSGKNGLPTVTLLFSINRL